MSSDIVEEVCLHPTCRKAGFSGHGIQRYCCCLCGKSWLEGDPICDTSVYAPRKPTGFPVYEGSTRTSRVPRGRYVYVWFKDREVLPFYVGKGVGDRAWDVHYNEDRSLAACQKLRMLSKEFHVEIVRDNLTPEGSLLLESTLIRFVVSCGGRTQLSNQHASSGSKKEVPPLELPINTY